MSKLIRIVAFQTEIAQNLGNMIRSAACFGVPIDVIEPCGFPFSLKSLKRSAMDYADIAEITRHNDWESYCANTDNRRILVTTKAQTPYSHFEFQAGDALIFGRESAGVPDYVKESCDACVTIPMPGGGRSLNLSTSTGIVLSEALRQNGII